MITNTLRAVTLGATLAALAFAQPAATTQTAPVPDQQAATHDLTAIRVDAAAVHQTAMDIARMASAKDLKWKPADTRWNELQPSVEDMQLAAIRLQAMQLPAASSDAATLKKAEPLIWKIRSASDQLHTLLNQGNPLDEAKVASQAEALAHDAMQLSKLAGPANS